MNKEQLLSWAVKNLTVWPQAVDMPENVMWRNDEVLGVVLEIGKFGECVTKDEWRVARAARGVPTPAVATVTAHSILEQAGRHMRDRAATYDKPEGERSMGATVDAFRAITGHKLIEEQGWLFMSLLKAVRSQQGAYRADSYEDGAAYCALAGEAAARDRGNDKREG